MSKLKKMLIKFNIENAEEINEVFTLLCKYLMLDKKREEDFCFPNGGKVDVTILVNLAMRYGLHTELDFTRVGDDTGVVSFIPLTLDIKDVDEVYEEEDKKKAVQTKKDLEEIKKAKAKSSPPPKEEVKEEEKVVENFDDFDDL